MQVSPRMEQTPFVHSPSAPGWPWGRDMKGMLQLWADVPLESPEARSPRAALRQEAGGRGTQPMVRGGGTCSSREGGFHWRRGGTPRGRGVHKCVCVVCTHVHMCVCVCVHILFCARLCVRVCLCTWVHAHTSVHISACACVSSRVCTHTRGHGGCVQRWMHLCASSASVFTDTCPLCSRVCVHIPVPVCPPACLR